MTEVSFYILHGSALPARRHFPRRLIEQARRLGQQVLVTVDCAADAQHMDDLLWSFHPESFVPHRRLDALDQPPAPVEIGIKNEYGDHHDVLVNLSQQVPEQFSRFERLSEVVVQEPQVLQSTREQFSFYTARGEPVQWRNL